MFKVQFLFYPLGSKLEPQGEISSASKNERKPKYSGIQRENRIYTELTVNPSPNYTEVNYNNLKI